MIKVKIFEQCLNLPEFTTCKIIDCIQSIFSDYSIHEGFINLIIVEDEFLRKLKLKFFEVDAYTDVMAFNLEEHGDDIEGEIYISWRRVNINAKKYNSSVQKEFKRILIHGALHLLGFNDKAEKDKKSMTNLEDYYLMKHPERFYF